MKVTQVQSGASAGGAGASAPGAGALGFKEPAAVPAVTPALAFVVASGAQIFMPSLAENARVAGAIAAVNQGGRVTAQ